MKSLKLLLTILLMNISLVALADDITLKYQLIQNPDFLTKDLAVAALNVMDYGADPTGQTDQTELFQKLLDRLANVGNPSKNRGDYRNLSGGILYVPAGRYLFKGQLVVPTGVTMRGDWKEPEAGKPITGTILAIEYAEGSSDEEQAFILMQPSTEVSHLAFWYPNQRINDVKVYPPTIHFGCNGVWGNDYVNARFITLVNSYIGIQFCTTHGGGCPNIYHLYGSPLYKGVLMDCLADVGRFDHIRFSSEVWSDSQLPDAPSQSSLSAWLRKEATGFVMRRNDWSYTCKLEVDGYHIGFHGDESPKNAQTYGMPNGHNYNWTLRDCEMGIYLSAMSRVGARFTRVKTPGCDIGVYATSGMTGPASFYGCNIEGSQKAIYVDDDAGASLILTDCEVDGETMVRSGQFLATSNLFGGDVSITPAARTIYTGNTLASGAQFNNQSLFECAISDEAAKLKALPDFPEEYMEIPETKPSRAALYVVTDAPFNAQPYAYGIDINQAVDCTSAIQKALDQAALDGGGIVYLPMGHYRMDGRLRIPTNVELKGASDLATVARGQGAILEIQADEGNENADPFITMDVSSGLRGITVDYPKQDSPLTPIVYPYTVRGNADCYIVNFAMRTVYRGIDFFTNKCDRHYVDYVSGHAFRNVIRIGGGSQDGLVTNIQCNPIAYGCGDETKFGSWPNSMKMADSYGLHYQDYAGSQNKEQLDFLVVGDCDHEVLYNNFAVVSNRGLLFQDDGKGGATNVKALGNAIDAAVYSVVVNGIGTDLDLVNSQLVSVNQTGAYVIDKELMGSYITMGEQVKNTVTIMGADNWGNGNCYASVHGGTLRLQQANITNSGALNTFEIGENGRVEVTDGKIQDVKTLVASSGKAGNGLSLQSAVVDLKGVAESDLSKATNLLPMSWELITGTMLPRDGWVATCNEGSYAPMNAIDGNAVTRWSTVASQTDGQWLQVDMRQPISINTVILDCSNSANDGPAGYQVEVATTEGDWKEVAHGANGGSCTVIMFPTQMAQYVRVTQTGTKSNYWSVHEFYVANSDEASDIKTVKSADEQIGKPRFYTLSGQFVAAPSAPGIYIDKNTRKKIIIR